MFFSKCTGCILPPSRLVVQLQDQAAQGCCTKQSVIGMGSSRTKGGPITAYYGYNVTGRSCLGQ